MPFPKFLAVAFSVVCCWTLEAATPARWGLSANSGLFFNCDPGGGCTGNVRDVFDGTWRSYDSTLTSESTADYGTARVSVEMISRGSAFFPKISGVAESIGTNSHHNDGWGIAVEGYRYTGLAPATLEFNGTLSGESNGSRTSEGLTAEVYFFKDEGFVYYPHLPTLLGETSAQVITNFAMRIASTNSGAALSKKATISVQPGELIYIYAELMIGVNRQAGKTITVNGAD